MDEKHLKPHQYYSDLYDRGTVERCRRTEERFETISIPEDKKFGKKELERMRAGMKKLYLYMESGERYLQKSETIREWMDHDRAQDELLERATPPEDIRCLTCRNRVTVTFKELYQEHGKDDRVLFMFDCPNKCLPRRAFFNTGEEWRVKPDTCPSCDAVLKRNDADDGKVWSTTYTCPKCPYTKHDSYEWSHKKDGPIDEHFAVDRDRFCLTPEEGSKYQQTKWNMENMARLGKEFEEKEKARAEKLAENPKGFHLEGTGYTCFICGTSTPQNDNWYDKWGIKCLACQWAIDHNEIPASLAKNKESWYSKYDLERAFNIKSPTLRKWVKDGILKSRTVSHYGKGVHYELFLTKDNKGFLPPKKLIKSCSVSEEKDGKVWHSSRPWYQCVKDPFEHLKGYKIMDYMRLVPPEEMAQREKEKVERDELKREHREKVRESKKRRSRKKQD